MFKTKIKENFEFLGNRVSVFGDNPRSMLIVNGPFREDFEMVHNVPSSRERLKRKYGDVLVMETDIVFPQPDSLFEELVSKQAASKKYMCLKKVTDGSFTFSC